METAEVAVKQTKVDSEQTFIEVETTEISVFEKEKKGRPSQNPVPILDFVPLIVSIFHNIEPSLDEFLIHVIKLFQLGWRHTGWAFSKIAPVAEKGLIMELEDESSSGWENVAQKNWNRRAHIYQNQLKKVAKVTSEVVRKGVKSSKEFTQGVANDLNKELARKVLKQART